MKLGYKGVRGVLETFVEESLYRSHGCCQWALAKDSEPESTHVKR